MNGLQEDIDEWSIRGLEENVGILKSGQVERHFLRGEKNGTSSSGTQGDVPFPGSSNNKKTPLVLGVQRRKGLKP